MAGPLKQPNKLTLTDSTGAEYGSVSNFLPDGSGVVHLYDVRYLPRPSVITADTLEYKFPIDTIESGIYIFKLDTPDTTISAKWIHLK